MKMIVFLCLLGISSIFISCKSESSQPNIVMFLVDDLGWQDTSVPFYKDTTHFNRLYETPAMEKLSSLGMKFTQAYATAVCSPTRISLMTGMNAARHRVTNWTLRPEGAQEPQHPFLYHGDWNVHGMSMDPETPRTVHAMPLPQILRQNGYKTIHVGKAHFGAIGTPAENPLNIGFDVNIAGHAAGAPGSYYGERNYSNNRPNPIWDVPGLEEFHGSKTFLSEALTQKAIEELKKSRDEDRPFFLYMAHYAVHTPIQADSNYLEKYLAKGMHPTEAAYATLVEGMDKSLGDIMAWLEENEMMENTAILFMSDNGGLSAAHRGGEKHTHNYPLNSGKGSAYEGGIREPMMVYWDGIVNPGSVTDEPVIIEDFFTTILEMAGVQTFEAVQHIDGKSFVPVLKGGKGLERPFFWHYPNYWGNRGPGIGPSSTIRKGDWKLIYFHTDFHFELFNISEDIGERNNLFDSERSIADSLARELGDYLRSVNADMPYDSAKNSYVPWPDEVL